MSKSGIEEIELRLQFEDLEGDEYTGEEPADVLDYDLDFAAPVIRLSEDRFRITEPLSLLLGPHGPRLNLGDIIEVRPLHDGSYRYLRTLESARIWTTIIHLPWLAQRLAEAHRQGHPSNAGRILDHVLREGEVDHVLEQLVEAGGAWEYCVGNLTVQLPRELGETEPPARLRALLDRLQQESVRVA